MKRLWILALALAPCVCVAKENNEAANYRYVSQIELPEPTQSEELAQVLLTPEMFRETLDNYADIKVVRSDTQQMVPCLVECVTEEQRKVRRNDEGPLTLVSASDEQDNQLRVTFSRPQKPAGQKQDPLCGLTVKTPLRNFERHVQVEVSDDGNTWKTVVEQARIFDISSFADLRVTDIALPPVLQRHIRLTFKKHDQQTGAATQVRTSTDGKGEINTIDRSFQEEQRSFRIDRVDGWSEMPYWERDVRPLRTREIRTTDAQPNTLKNKDRTLICFEADRVPLESLKLDSPERFVKVPYELYVEVTSDIGETFWRRIASGVLERVAFRDYLSEQMTITWSTTRATRYCLSVLHTEGTPALSFVEAKGPDYRVVFPYAKGDSMALLIGNSKATLAGFNADQIKMLMRTITKPLLATPSSLAAQKPETNVNMTYVLFGAIALVVIVLGFALVSAMRRLPAHEE